MRPEPDDRAVRLLLDAVPRLVPLWRDLAELYGEDLTPEVVLMELADVVTTLVVTRREDGLLEECLDGLEAVAGDPTMAPGAGQLVELCFLNELSPATLEHLRPMLGEHLTEALGRMEGGGGTLSP